MDEQTLETTRLANAPAPRVTLAHINRIADTARCEFIVQGTLTICIMTTADGFHLVGKSAAASPENFDADVGRELARDDARKQLWQLEGYVLKAILAGRVEAAPNTDLLALVEGRKQGPVLPTPDWCYLAENWDATVDWGEREDLMEGVRYLHPVKVGVLTELPPRWLVMVPVVEGVDEVMEFATLEEAQATIDEVRRMGEEKGE